MSFLLACPAIALEPPTFTVVQSEASGPYLEFTNALRAILSSRGISPQVIDADQPLPSSGLVISVGMKAATAVAASEAPAVLNTLIPKSGYEKILRDFPQRAGSRLFSAIFLDQPIERQISLISAALPDKRKIGLLYSSPPAELAAIRQKAKQQNLHLHEQVVGEAVSLPEALRDLLPEVEVLLAFPDSAVYNASTVRNILLTTYRSGVPMVGYSSGYVNAGALCAVSSSPAQIAAQAAVLIERFGGTRTLPSAQYPQQFKVLVNEQVARSLGLHIKSADELHQEIEADKGYVP